MHESLNRVLEERRRRFVDRLDMDVPVVVSKADYDDIKREAEELLNMGAELDAQLAVLTGRPPRVWETLDDADGRVRVFGLWIEVADV